MAHNISRTISLRPAVDALLQLEAKDRGWTVSAVVQEALLEFLSRHSKGRDQTTV